MKQPENTTRIVIEGQCRATIINPVFDEKCLVAEVKPYEEENEYLTARDSALMRTVKNEFDKYLEISPKMPSDIIFKVALCKRPGELADFTQLISFLTTELNSRFLKLSRNQKDLNLFLMYL